MLEHNAVEEDIYRRVMRCYVRVGRPAEAMQVYQRCRNMLSRILDIAPAQETWELYRTIVEMSRK